MPQFQTTLPTVLTAQCENHASVDTLKGLAQDETRLGLLPVVRRRLTACGVQPGAHFFLELPYLNSRAFQLWLDGFAAAFPESLHLLVLDNGAGHKAQAVQWPSNVGPVLLPP